MWKGIDRKLFFFSNVSIVSIYCVDRYVRPPQCLFINIERYMYQFVVCRLQRIDMKSNVGGCAISS